MFTKTTPILLFLCSTGYLCAGSANPWLGSRKHDQIAYFVYQSPAEIQRYDLDQEVWLDLITLQDVPDTFWVDDAGLYLSSGTDAYRYNLDGTGRQLMQQLSHPIHGMATLGDYLLIFDDNTSISGSRLVSVNKWSGALIQDVHVNYTPKGITFHPAEHILYARTTWTSPDTILRMVVNANGTINPFETHWDDGDFPAATQTWIHPNGAWVFNDNGIVNGTVDLTYHSSLGGAFDQMDFHGDDTIFLRGQRLYRFGLNLLESGRLALTNDWRTFYVHGDTITGFYDSAAGIVSEAIAVSAIVPGVPVPPLDPNGLEYMPDQITTDGDNVIYLLDRENKQIFRWSRELDTYLPSIPLWGEVSHMTYSAAQNRLYVSYDGGAIHAIDDDESKTERPFVYLPQSCLGLATFDAYLFAVDTSHAWYTHYVFEETGQLLSMRDYSENSLEYRWNAPKRRMYFSNDGSPRDIFHEPINVNGEIGMNRDSPYHGDVEIAYPIRISPDGTEVMLGSGLLFHWETLLVTGSVGQTVQDMGWLLDTLVTVENQADHSLIKVWDPELNPVNSFTLDGNTVKLVTLDQSLVLITQVDGLPEFTEITLCTIFDEPFANLRATWPEITVLDLTTVVNQCPASPQ